MVGGPAVFAHILVVTVADGLFEEAVLAGRAVGAQLDFAVWLTEVAVRATVVTLLGVGGLVVAVPTVGTGIISGWLSCGAFANGADSCWVHSFYLLVTGQI